MTKEDRVKEKINKGTMRSCLPNAKVVYVKHCLEEVPLDGHSPWGGICHLIHKDVTVKQFFSERT